MSIRQKCIAIVLGTHLAFSPRSQKEARALRDAGADVVIRGVWFDQRLASEDLRIAVEMGVDFAAAADLRSAASGSLLLRGKQRAARDVLRVFGIATARAFGSAVPELLKAATELRPAAAIVHGEAGLWVGRELLRQGRKVCADFEDWYSRDLLDADRIGRPVISLAKLERYMLREAQCCFAPTTVMAQALAKEASLERPPVVIPNAFPASERTAAGSPRSDERAVGRTSFYWYSQTIGPGRGLESLAQALSALHGRWRLVLRGSLGTHRAWFEETFSGDVRRNVQVVEPVPNAELLARTMAHDVGLALEQPYCESRDLTATNKIFEYLRAGIAVIATRTRGQQEIFAAAPEIGLLVEPGAPEALAAAMQRYIDSAEDLAKARRAALEAGASTWDWRRFGERLVESVDAVA